MLEIVLFLSGIRKEQETAGGVLIGQFGPTDTSSSQPRSVHFAFWEERRLLSFDKTSDAFGMAWDTSMRPDLVARIYSVSSCLRSVAAAALVCKAFSCFLLAPSEKSQSWT